VQNAFFEDVAVRLIVLCNAAGHKCTCATQMLSAYVLVCSGMHFSVSYTTSGGKKCLTLLQTQVLLDAVGRIGVVDGSQIAADTVEHR
jgi:hypothetical protein